MKTEQVQDRYMAAENIVTALLHALDWDLSNPETVSIRLKKDIEAVLQLQASLVQWLVICDPDDVDPADVESVRQRLRRP